MHCVKFKQTIEDTIKKSRFIGQITPCISEQEVLQSLRELYQQHVNASHIAYAYRILTNKGLVSRFHDAGEPNGTAGKPIYQHLDGRDLINVLITVIRYFGGIKLGAGGLTRAYGNSAKKAIEAAELIDYVEYTTIPLQLHYKQMRAFAYQLNKLDGKIIQQVFSEHVELIIRLPKTNAGKITDQF